MSDLDDEELEATRIKTVRQAYDTVYTEMCRYMELYNQAEEEIEKLKKDYEQTISELYEEKERYRKMYFDLKDTTKEALDKMEYHADYETHDIYNNLKSKVTEKELKDMILGMLE